ncbi:MAG: hypothetical protein PUB21_01470, partial [Bacteroidales bacterium]|nr:hypothetical protein [Bacteroidales bacterium]
MKQLSIFILLFFAFSLFAQEEIIISSPRYLKANDTVWVVKPTDYDASKSYPIVYMLHGHGGDYKNYLSGGNFQDIADKYGFILVTPDGFKDC